MNSTEDDVAVHIVAACYNGARYLEAFLQSVQAQTYGAWTLWARDDGSDDDTASILRAYASADPRIRLCDDCGPRLGATGSFRWLLEQVPADVEYVMFADQDDVWLPDKIARTLAIMQASERTYPGALLVHTDLTVVDAALCEIHRSFWAYSHVRPEPVSLRRLVVQNVVTGATAMFNRRLREAVGRIPPGALYHDWWLACVAAAFGRIVAIPNSTVLYRQHGENVVGAKRGVRHRWRDLPAAALRALRETAHLRVQLARGSAQADAFLERYGPMLGESDRSFLRDFARLPAHGLLRRKAEVLRLRLRREHGLWRNLGILLRA